MTTVVLDSKDLAQSVITGVVPVPPGVAEDNAAQAAKREGANGKVSGGAVGDKGSAKGAGPSAESTPKAEAAAETQSEENADDIEGEDGLTPRQKREFTKSMLATIAKKHRAQREAEELATSEYNRSRLAEERAERLDRELAALKRQTAPEPAAAAEAAPDRKDFDTEEKYQDALIDYRVDQKLKAKEAQEEQARQEREQQETLAHARANIERAIELVPDYKEVTEAVDMPVPPHIARYMQSSDMFAELGYHFAKNPEVLEKLTEYTANIRPGTEKFVDAITRSLVELGKIESKLSPFAARAKVNSESDGTPEPSRSNGVQPSTETGTAPSKPRVQAPIIRPLSAGSGAQVDKAPHERTAAEDLAAWQRKHNVKLTARKRH